MQMSFVRFTKGLTNKDGHLIPATDNIYDTIKNNPGQDYYTSLYRYNHQHLEHFKNTKSVAGIKDVTTPKILFDFDDATDIEMARKDAITVCARLVQNGVPEEKLRIFFSGSKGFAVEAITDQNLTRQEFVNIVFNLAADLSSFDTKINDEPRIIRAPLSQHPKSKLHKIPLSLSELGGMSLEQIKRHAKDISHYNSDDLHDDLFKITMPEALNILKTKQYKKVGPIKVETDLKFNTYDIDFSKAPSWMARERFCLQEGYFFGSDLVGKGERNTAFMILGATYKNQGFGPEHTLGLLMSTSEKQAKRTGEDPYTEEQMKREIINTIFSESWQGGIYGKDEELLQLTRARFNIKDGLDEDASRLVKISDVAERFKHFAKTFKQNQIKTGIRSIDENVLITTGMMIGLLGCPSSGKSTLCNAFVEHLSKQGTPVIYQSLDMWDNLLYTRMLQKHCGYDMRKILDMFENNNADQTLIDAYSKVIENHSSVEFNFRSGPTVEEIEQDVISYKKTTGKQPKLLVVDYLEKVRGPFSDPTANGAYVASRLSDIAKTHDLAVLLLLQPQKSAGDPRDELLSMRKIKGASVIEQDCRLIMTLWRPGFDPTDSSRDKYSSIAIVKNNMGGMCQIDLGWHGVTGTFRELDSNDKKDLQNLINDVKEKKALVARDDI